MSKLIIGFVGQAILFVSLTGCGVGLAVVYPAECPNETPSPHVHDLINLWHHKITNETKAEFLRHWGKPDSVEVKSANDETWNYDRHLWCGVIPWYILPLPLLLPVCDGYDRVDFQGDQGGLLHTRHSVFAGIVFPFISGIDPACRQPLPPDPGVSPGNGSE